MRYLYLMLVVLTINACDDDTSTINDDVLVIEAYLNAGKPIEGIHLTRMISYLAVSDTIPEVSGATMRLWLDDQELTMMESEQQGYYECVDKNILPAGGQLVRIEVPYNDQLVSAETVVPSKPENFTTEEEVVFRDRVDSFQDLLNGANPFSNENNITVSWNNSDQTYHYVLVESLESDPESIVNLDLSDFAGFEILIPPTNAESQDIFRPDLPYFGRYQAILYHVNLDYYNLYESTEQDSRNLNEPVSNVQGGLGIFTSFNQDTLYFEIREN